MMKKSKSKINSSSFKCEIKILTKLLSGLFLFLYLRQMCIKIIDIDTNINNFIIHN